MLQPNAMAAKANPRAISTRISSRNRVDTNGQRNHDVRKGKLPKYVDPERSHLNRILMDPLMGGQLAELCERRRDESGRVRQRKASASAAVSTVGIITFGVEAQQWMAELEAERQDAMFRELAEAIAKRLNTTLHGLVVHLDESALHAHYQLAAVAMDGRPVSQVASRPVLEDLQTIAATIAQKYEPRIERGHKKQSRLDAGAPSHELVHRHVQQLHADLPKEIAALEAERDATQEKKEKNERLAEKAELAAQAGGEKAAAAAKRLGIYQGRIASSESEIVRLTDALEPLRAAYDQLKGQIDRAETEAAARRKSEDEAAAKKIAEAEAAAAEELRKRREEAEAEIARKAVEVLERIAAEKAAADLAFQKEQMRLMREAAALDARTAGIKAEIALWEEKSLLAREEAHIAEDTINDVKKQQEKAREDLAVITASVEQKKKKIVSLRRRLADLSAS